MRRTMKKTLKNRKLVCMLLTVFILTAGLCTYFGMHSFAASDIYITMDGDQLEPSVPVEMTSRNLQLVLGSDASIYANTALYKVQWTIETGNEVASITNGSQQSIGIVTALSPGEVTITASVMDATSDSNTLLGTATCKIRVVFAVDTTGDNRVFKYPNDTATSRSMFMRSTTGTSSNIITEKQLTLNFGDYNDAQWATANEDVATVVNGKVKAVGAGKTRITATYTQEGTANTYVATIDVYVYPSVNDTDSNYTSYKSIGMSTGSYIYTDALFAANPTETIRNKVIWSIGKDENGNETIISDSVGNRTSDLISIDTIGSRDNRLQVNGKAGKYMVYFYPKDAYENQTNAGHISSDVYTPTAVELFVYANFGDYNDTLAIGSQFNMAETFNLTEEEFKKYFDVTFTCNVGEANNYMKTYNDDGIVEPTARSTETTTITAHLKVKDAYKDAVEELTNPANIGVVDQEEFKINLTVANAFTLNRNYITAKVGEKINLVGYLDGVTINTITWESSDTSYVTVSSSGQLEALRETSQDITIKATCTSVTVDGNHPIATCKVKVEKAPNTFTIAPEEAMMNVGDKTTILMTCNPDVAIGPYSWQVVNNADCVTTTVSTDNKSCVVEANKVPSNGDAIQLTVINTLTNESVATCRITIIQPYETMKLNKETLTLNKGEWEQLSVSYTPASVTQKDLTWTSLDTSVVTVDNQGRVTAVNPGVTQVLVSPKYNPNQIFLSCLVTVNADPDTIDLSSTDVTVEAGDKELVYVDLAPNGCNPTLNITSLAPTVATAEYNETRQIITITGVKAGNTMIQVEVPNNKGISTYINVHVTQACSKVEFSAQNHTMYTGETYTPELKVSPADTTDTFEYTSFNPAAATVDKTTGLITGVKSGTAVIQVTSSTGKVATLVITVLQKLNGLTLDASSKTIEKDESFTLTPTFDPEDAYNKTLSWVSTNPNVASITPVANGYGVVVKGLQGGVTMIQALAEDGGYLAYCMVTVTEKSTSITLNPTKKYVAVGKTFKIKATVNSVTSTNKGVTWSTGNKKIATVTSAGKVKGKKIGTTTIKAKAKDGSGATATCKVYVVRKVKTIKLNKYTATLLVGKTLKLKKTVLPKNATVRTVTWSSSDNSIATVDATGRVSGISAGLVKIRAKAKDGSGVTAVCLINVKDPVEATGVTVPNAELIVAKGRRIQSGIKMSPANSTDTIKYFSDNKGVATVDKYGRITAKNTGEATIYGQTSGGQIGYTEVLVVAMNRSKLSMRQYDSQTLWVNQISTGVQWYSSNPLVASVANGKVIGLKPGSTTIYAVVRGLRLPCRVTIKTIS